MIYTDEFFIGSIIALAEDLDYSEIKVVTDQYDDDNKIEEPLPMVFYFNKKTRIRGCTFKQLDLRDQVKVNRCIVVMLEDRKVMFCEEIEILNIEKKWDDILRKDKKYSTISPSTLEVDSMIRPEVIKPSVHKCSDEDYEKLQLILKTKLPKQHRKIIELFMDGKSTRQMGKAAGCSHEESRRIIKRYLK
jgi:hypothetical protein